VIRQATGATPSEWIARFVVVKAKLLMRTTDLSMLRISQELGFPDQTSFTRYFKANTGYPPTAYRTKRCE
jgi:transcriptional regulator GlxA family with amidase domain